MGTRLILLLLALGFSPASLASAEIIVGLNGGIVIPGDQDLAFKEYATDSGLARRVDTDNVRESVGPLVGVSVTGWGDWSFLRYFALQLETMYWYVEVEPATPIPPAPRFTIGEQRVGFLGSVLGRLPLYPLFGRFSPEKGRDTFAYLGVGAGAVYSTVTHGSHDWGWGYQLLGGISVPIVSRLRLRLEGRYILTGDVDTATGDRLVGWKVDTSGTPTRLRKNETVDTRFMPIIVGLDWRF